MCEKYNRSSQIGVGVLPSFFLCWGTAMKLNTCTIVDAHAIAQQLPVGVASGQFEDDDVVVVSPRTGLVFKLYQDGASLWVDS